MWSWLGGSRDRARRRAGLASAPALADFLAREAWLIAQKSVIGYCHAKTRLPMNELMREARFVDAYARSRAEAFAAVLGDLVAVVEARLRPAAGTAAPALADALAALAADVLGSQRFFPGPAEDRPDAPGPDVAEALRQRLHTLQLAAPHGIAELAATSGKRVFETLPIHTSLRWYDEEPVVANVQFMMVSLARRLDTELDPPALVGALLARHQGAAPSALADRSPGTRDAH